MGLHFSLVQLPLENLSLCLCCERELRHDINNSNQRLIMAGPIEMLIVAGAFGIIGTYLYIVHRFIRSGEEPAAKQDRPDAVSSRPSPSSKLTTITSH